MNLNSVLPIVMCVVAAISPLAEASPDSSTQVLTEGGAVQGMVTDGVAAFKGLPYARAPVGSLRWRAPQPVQAWDGVRDASKLSPDCMQGQPGPTLTVGAHPVAEDCLYLNVWRPSTRKQKLPVMVWIHGGGFVNGGSSSPDSTGESMAARGLVFVSFNYRLGRFGFFGFPELTVEHSDEAKGNYGIMDQIAALQWIRRNIKDFGGDPDNVTVVGESAGGMSINMLLTSPAAKGLFERAIVQSGAGRQLPRERHLDKDLPDAAAATTMGVAFARRHNIKGEDAVALAKLRALSAEQITDGLNMATVLQGDKSLYAGPVIDGRLLPETPEQAFASGRHQRVPLIVGATTWDLGYNDARTPAEAFAAFGPDAEAARRAYDPSGRGDIQAINAAIAADRAMVEPARFIARAMSAAGIPVFEYRFDYVLEAKRAQSPFGAQHATDVAFALGRLDAAHGVIVTAEDRKMSDAMADYWASFARRDDPNRKGLPGWPIYRRDDERLLMFRADGTISAIPDPWRTRLDIAERVVGGAPEAVASRPRSTISTDNLPASFEGELPCADCSAIRYHLDLLPERLYFLRATYTGTERQIDTVGSWTVSTDGARLVLAGGRNGPVGFVIENISSLRWLRREGTDFVGVTNYALKRAAAFQPIEPHTALTGSYRYFADSGTFTPCGTQHRLPVAQEGDNAALEAAYVRLVPEPRGDTLAHFEGRIVMRHRMESDGLQPALVVDRLMELRPGETCETPLAQASLEDSYWKLTILGDAPVILKGKQAEPHLILRSQDLRISGNAGCNRMVGQYTLDGSKLEFGKLVSTRMACLAGMDIEQHFLTALEQARIWHIDGQHLELFDADNRRLARFESRLMK